MRTVNDYSMLSTTSISKPFSSFQSTFITWASALVNDFIKTIFIVQIQNYIYSFQINGNFFSEREQPAALLN